MGGRKRDTYYNITEKKDIFVNKKLFTPFGTHREKIAAIRTRKTNSYNKFRLHENTIYFHYIILCAQIVYCFYVFPRLSVYVFFLYVETCILLFLYD